MINRTYLLSRMHLYAEKELITFLVGVRGVGKSSILTQIINLLKENKLADDFHIILLNLEFLENIKYRNPKTLEKYIKDKITDEQKYYLLLDEIEYVDKFENLLISIYDSFKNVKIVATASTNRLLPENLNSSIKNKSITFYITPFSYKELCEAIHSNAKDRKMLDNYIKYGGFPARINFNKSSEVKRYLYSNLDSIYLRDVVVRFGIKTFDILNSAMQYVIQNVGADISLEGIDFFLKDNQIDVSKEDFYTALDCLEKAMVINSTKLYNVNTGSISRPVSRYYLSDLGISYLFGLDINSNKTAVLRNLVWIELKKRGYDIYTGLNNENKFDFVAMRREKTIYIDVVEYIADGQTANQEAEKLLGFDDSNQKLILSLDKEDYSRKGVIHQNIIDFLLNDASDVENLDLPIDWVTIE